MPRRRCCGCLFNLLAMWQEYKALQAEQQEVCASLRKELQTGGRAMLESAWVHSNHRFLCTRRCTQVAQGTNSGGELVIMTKKGAVRTKTGEGNILHHACCMPYYALLCLNPVCSACLWCRSQEEEEGSGAHRCWPG